MTTGVRRRRWTRWIPTAVLMCVVVLVASGCLATDAAGLQVRPDGTLVAVNCGTWIREVTVTDADSGRKVWSAHATQTKEDEGIDDVGTVVIGVLPSARWSGSEYQPNPRPQRWRVTATGLGETTVIEVPDAGLKPGRVYREGGKSMSEARFDQSVCSGMPISLRASRLLFLALVVAVALGIAGVRLRQRRRPHARSLGDHDLTSLPPPPHAVAPADGDPPAGTDAGTNAPR